MCAVYFKKWISSNVSLGPIAQDDHLSSFDICWMKTKLFRKSLALGVAKSSLRKVAAGRPKSR